MPGRNHPGRRAGGPEGRLSDRALAHELNNLLTLVMSYTELAQAEIADRPAAVRDLARVRAAADRAAHLVRQLVDAADVEVDGRGGARADSPWARRARAGG